MIVGRIQRDIVVYRMKNIFGQPTAKQPHSAPAILVGLHIGGLAYSRMVLSIEGSCESLTL